jgi:glutamyl-tRNA reductase
VKNETKINEGNCSIGCVAIDLAEQMFPNIQACQIVLIGAGDIMQVVAKNLKARDVDNICIANRNFTKAIQLAEEVGGTAIPFHKIDEQFGQADIIISGTGSSDYLFRYDDMKEVLKRRWDNPLLIIDIALPRDFETEIGHLPNVTLKNLYDLQAVVDLNLKKREQEIPKAEKIIAEEVRKFRSWKEALRIKPTIQAVTENFERIRIPELEKQRSQFSDETFSQLDHFTKSLTNKYIHHIISNLKLLHKVCSLTPNQVHIIEQLFGCYEDIEEYPHCGFKRQQPCAKTDTNGD